MISIYSGNKQTFLNIQTESGVQKLTYSILRKYSGPYSCYINEENIEGYKIYTDKDPIVYGLITWASGQGGLVFAWDTNKNDIVHFSEGSYAVEVAVYPEYNKVVYLAEVQHYGTKPYVLLCYSDFGVLDIEKEADTINIGDQTIDINDKETIKKYLTV